MTFTTAAISATWVVTALSACAIAGHFSLQLLAMALMCGTAHAIIATNFELSLHKYEGAAWHGATALCGVLSWAVLSLLILYIALAPWPILTLTAMLCGGGYCAVRGRARSGELTRPSFKKVPAERALIGLALIGAVSSLYVAYPALHASAVGYSAYDATIWIDAPFHASYVNALGDALDHGRYVDIHGTGLPTQLYHHGAYTVAALIHATTGVSALAITQVITVWGGLWLVLALYSLISAFTSEPPIVAACAALVVLLLPDSSALPWGHSLYGFHWLLQVATASSIALAIALCALTLVVVGCRWGQWQVVALGWIVAASVAMFKAQLFVAISVPIFLYPTLAWPMLARRRRVTAIWLQLTFVALVTAVASHSPSLPLIRFDFSAAPAWLAALAINAPKWQGVLLLEAARGALPIALAVMALTSALWLWSLPAAAAVVAAIVMPLADRVVGALPRSRLLVDPVLSCARSENPSKAPLYLFAATFVLTCVALAPDNRLATGGPLEVHVQAQIWGYVLFASAAALNVAERAMRFYGRTGILATTASAALAFVLLTPLNAARQRMTPIVVPSFGTAPSKTELASLRSALQACDIVFVADGDRLFWWQAALERRSWVVDYALNPHHRAAVTKRLSEWQDNKSGVNLESWLAARGVTWFVLPRNAGAASHKRPSRNPDIATLSYEAWKVAPTPAVCRIASKTYE